MAISTDIQLKGYWVKKGFGYSFQKQVLNANYSPIAFMKEY